MKTLKPTLWTRILLAVDCLVFSNNKCKRYEAHIKLQDKSAAINVFISKNLVTF